MVWPFAAAAGLLTTVWGWFLVTPNFYSLEAALLSLLALACYVYGAPSWRWMVAAGVAAGATAMVKQNVGAYTAAGLFVTIWASRLFDDRPDWRGRMKMSGQFIAGVSLPVLATVSWLAASGAGSYLYESWVYYPLVKYTERFALPVPGFFSDRGGRSVRPLDEAGDLPAGHRLSPRARRDRRARLAIPPRRSRTRRPKGTRSWRSRRWVR